MDHPEKMKAYAVPAAKINWQCGCSSPPNQTRGRSVPCGVRDFSLWKLPVRDFTRWKDGEHPALPQPGQRLADRAPVGINSVIVGRPVSLKRIHEYAMPRQFRHIAQQIIRHHFHVRPHTSQQHRQHGSIQHSEGMVGYNYDWTGGGNPPRIRRIDTQIYAHLRQQVLKPEPCGRLLHPPVERPYLLERKKFLRQGRYARESLNVRQHFRPRFFFVQMVEWHLREIPQALCGRMKRRLKADEMPVEEKLESN